MTKQEAYVELREKVDAINKATQEASQFAREHGLVFNNVKGGTPLSVACAETWDGEKYPKSPYDYEEDSWVSSEICW